MFWILFLSFSVFAQEELDLSAINDLEEELPSTEYSGASGTFEQRRYTTRHRYPFKKTSLKSVLASGTEHGHVKAGNYLIRLEDGKAVELTEPFYGKFYRLQDDLGFKYVQSNDGSCIYKLKTEFVNNIEKELALYEPPLKYTPAPVNIVRSEYDKKLKIRPEVTILVGLVEGSYMKDLFNDNKANSGATNQFGVHFATDWQLPIKAGLVVHYEKSSYKLRDGGNVFYTSPSFGPQFKTKDFEVWGKALRFQTQFRVSPFARAMAETSQGDITFKFNSADLLLAAEHPIKNQLGEFVLGLFFQSQWLNIKDQPETVSVNASNETNKSFGLSLGQVF
ncbi:MAG: hypothetical protein H0V66_09095 [Bdellovibrionales bacterium]|nr:hypothetical protein [Bdellovibrionales bacterium]